MYKKGIPMEKKPSLGNALGWKMFERFGVQGSQFVLQIILARLLSPEHYGVLSLMVIFTTLANVFVQSGFNTALIQNKDVTEEDYSSVFWVSFGIAGILYAVIFAAAPLIGRFYETPELVTPLRVLALMLLPGALNSVQLAKISREMNFKKVFFSNLSGILIAGGTGIAIALLGGGLWALVAQTLLNVCIVCIVMFFTSKLRLRFVCNWKRVGVLFRFGWKLLTSSLLDNLYNELRSLVIGKKYDSGTLGYYNRGKNFPQFIITAVSGTVQSVLLPAMSKEQENRGAVKALTRSSISLSSYILFPLMAGLAGVAAPMVKVLLTDKWLPCVPYLQAYCFSLAFNPIHVGNLQAINAMGRSDIFLKLEIIKKSYGMILIVLALVLFDSPLAIALSGCCTTIISCFVNAHPNKKLIGYSYAEQMVDILPSFLMSVLMCGAVLAVQLLKLNVLLTLILQVLVGLLVYIALSAVFKPAPYRFLMGLIDKKLHKTN